MIIRDRIVVVASTNMGKVGEIVSLLKDFPIVVKKLDEFDHVFNIKEDGKTFEENAFKKASVIAKKLGIPAIADDSGLVVPALGGAPGVYSARYAGVEATDLQRCRKLLLELKNCSDRSAYFQCVISLAVPTGQALTYEGRCQGRISDQIIGENGFGYDPIFYCSELGKTFAELTFEEKNDVSHRGAALKLMVSDFEKVLKWLDFKMEDISRDVCCFEPK